MATRRAAPRRTARRPARGAPAGPQINLANPLSVLEASQRQADEAALRNTQLANPDVFNPYGSSRTDIDPTSGRVSIRQELAPAEQAALEARRARESQYSGLASQLLGNIGQSVTSPLDTPEATRSRIEESLYSRAKQRLDEDFAKREEQERQRLYNSGNPMGSEGFRNWADQYSRDRSSAILDAQAQAMAQAGQESDRLFAQQQAQRDEPYKRLASVMSGLGGPVNPQFAGYNPVQRQSPDLLGFASLAENQRATNLATRRSGGGGGRRGGGGSVGYSADDLNAAMRQGQESALASLAGQRKPSGSGWGDVLGSIGGSVAAGLGKGLGNWVSGLF